MRSLSLSVMLLTVLVGIFLIWLLVSTIVRIDVCSKAGGHMIVTSNTPAGLLCVSPDGRILE